MSSKKNDLFYVHLAIVLLFMLGFRFLPAPEPITPVGMQVIGIFAGGIYGWVTIGLLLPSILGILTIGLTDLITTSAFFEKGFGSQTFVLVLGMLIISSFISKTNLSDVILRTLLSSKAVNGKPWLTLLCLLYAAFLVASVSNSLVAALLIIPLYVQLTEKLNLPHHNRLNNVMICGIAFAGLMGDITFPFQIMTVMVLSAFSSASGLTVDFGRYLIAALPFSVVMIAVYMGICKYILRVDASMIRADVLNLNDTKTTKQQKLALIGVLCTLLLLVAPNFLPKTLGITTVLTTLGSGGCVLMAVAVMSMIHVEGKPLLDIRETAKGVSWDMLFLAAYFAPIASLLTSDDTGIKMAISGALQPILVNMSPILIVIMMLVIGVVLTNFMNNMVIAIIMVSTLSVIADFLPGFNLVALAVVVLYSSCIAFVLPSGCPTNAYCYSLTDLISFKGQLLHTLLVAVLMIVIMASAGVAWFSFIM